MSPAHARNTPDLPEVDGAVLAAVAEGRYDRPHSVLGHHEVAGGRVIRAGLHSAGRIRRRDRVDR